MSYKQKENIISLLSLLFTAVPYFIYINLDYQNQTAMTTSEELKFWATALLISIPIRIVAQIVFYVLMYILYAVANGEKEMDETTDERDNLIELKSERYSNYLFFFGFAIAMVAIVLDYSASTMFGILIVFGILSELMGIFSKMVLYRS